MFLFKNIIRFLFVFLSIVFIWDVITDPKKYSRIIITISSTIKTALSAFGGKCHKVKGLIHSLFSVFSPKIVSFLKNIYVLISVISTLTIFSAFILFLFGKMGIETSSDDDLIMRDIKNQISDNLTISSITTVDIHGFGNDSIIVLAADDYMYDYSDGDGIVANQLFVFDKIGNEFLNNVYNLFGYGSSFKLSYKFSLESDNPEIPYWGYSVKLLDVVELTGDLSKELVVMFRPEPAGTSGYYYIGVFSYSFESHSYYMLGTFPPAGQYKLGNYYRGSEPVTTIFHNSNANCYNYYGDEVKFQLESGTSDDNDFFIENDYGTRYLVRTKMIWGPGEGHPSPHRHIISVFFPSYNSDNNELEWRVTFSEETSDHTRYCTEKFVIDFLQANDRYDITGNEFDIIDADIY